MKGKRFFKSIALLVSLGVIVSACGTPAAVPVTGATPQVIQQTVEVQVTTVVEVTTTPGPASEASSDENPYRPTELLDAVQAIKDATAGKSPPDGAKYAILTNNLSPFWTAAQQGASRASAELGVPITFQGPTAADLLSQQLTMLETFVND
ncbi:MAG: hypothetical protein EHM33_23375, partial [Chloroflexi bacterium]